MKELVFTMGLVVALSVAASVKVYPYLDNPRLHPDDARRYVKPPDAEVLGHKLHFTSARNAAEASYKRTLDKYVNEDKLGDFIWQVYTIFDKPNFEEILREYKRRNLYLFDIWGFVPGCGKGPIVYQKTPTPTQVKLMEDILGDHWLGMDTGEQDGRYVGGYAGQTIPAGGTRFERYLDFQRFFERLHYLQGNRMAALVSLNFGHYLLKEECYTMIGAETAQALPNSQVYYSFIRGAGKQYGVPWFGNVSIYNRWGWKNCYPDGRTAGPNQKKAGSTKGTSLALMKKLMYAQMFYNSAALGFEAGFYWTNNGKNELSPIGKIQRGAVDWYEKNGDPGVMHAPVALMFDFYSGWSFPRHLYKGEVFRVWGALPYEKGDHLSDGILSMIYPGYDDSSYFRDERGFNTPTPYGDIADCVLSDIAAWQLARYPVVVLAGSITPSAEIRDTLAAYAAQGGKLLMTSGNAAALFPQGLPAGDVAILPGPAWGVLETPQCKLPVVSKVGEALPRPYPLAAETKAALDKVFRAERLFATSAEDGSDGLSIITCRRGKGDYTLCILNNTWQEQPLEIRSFAGKILSQEELPTDISEKSYVGYVHECGTNLVLGTDSPTRIAGGSVRLFRVKTDEGTAVSELPCIKPVANAANHYLNLRTPPSIKEEILKRPTFFRHFGGVMVNSTYLTMRTQEQLTAENNWFRLQGLKVLVDASPAINLFPDLRLCDNDDVEKVRTEKVFADILEKMPLIGAKDLMVVTHRTPETNMDSNKAYKNQYAFLAQLAKKAREKGITCHMRHISRRSTPTFDHLMNEHIAAIQKAEGAVTNLFPAASLATMQLSYNRYRMVSLAKYEKCVKFWFVAANALDENNQFTTLCEPLAPYVTKSGAGEIKDPLMAEAIKTLAERTDIGIIFDARYPDYDAEYRDVKLFSK